MTCRANMRMRGCRGQRGYVMIEALAALVLSGLVLASVPLASGMMIRTWQKVTSGSDRLDELATGLSVVRRELSVLQRARWPEGRRQRGEAIYAFLGNPETVGMVLSGEGRRAAPGEDRGDRIVMFTARIDENGSMLMRGSVPMLPDVTGFDQVQLENPVILLNGPWRYRFFYGVPGAGRLEWRDAWEKEESLPSAIRLDVLDIATGTRVVPPLVVPLRIEADPGCISEEVGPCGN